MRTEEQERKHRAERGIREALWLMDMLLPGADTKTTEKLSAAIKNALAEFDSEVGRPT